MLLKLIFSVNVFQDLTWIVYRRKLTSDGYPFMRNLKVLRISRFLR